MKELGPSPAYKERAKDPSLRQNCDFCAACFVYNCDGSTAMHHELHFNPKEYLDGYETTENSR